MPLYELEGVGVDWNGTEVIGTDWNAIALIGMGKNGRNWNWN
jgi:hypothetical protein